MKFETIIFEVEGNVGKIELNRPEAMNALSNKMREELVLVVDEVEKNVEIRVLVITGKGKAFCAGGDVRGWVPRKGRSSLLKLY